MNLKRLIPLGVILSAALAGCGVNIPLRGEAGQDASAKASTPAAPAGAQVRANGAPAQAAPAPAQAAGAAPNSSAFQGAAALQPLPPVNRMIVKNATLGISVDDPESSLSQVDQLVKTEQGVIASQTVRTQQDKTFVNLTIQVPPDNFEDTLARLRDLRARGTRVLNDTVSSQDVTEQFVDLDAQYRNLQATRDAYQKLLDRASAVADVITLTREIANTQTQMDQIKGRQNLLTRQAGISTIALSLAPVGATPVNPGPLPKPLQAAQQAWQALLTGLQGFAVVLIWMAILLPLPALALFGGWLVYRRATAPAPTRG